MNTVHSPNPALLKMLQAERSVAGAVGRVGRADPRPAMITRYQIPYQRPDRTLSIALNSHDPMVLGLILGKLLPVATQAKLKQSFPFNDLEQIIANKKPI